MVWLSPGQGSSLDLGSVQVSVHSFIHSFFLLFTHCSLASSPSWPAPLIIITGHKMSLLSEKGTIICAGPQPHTPH